MILEDLVKTHRYSMPGADLMCDYEAGVPIFRARLKVSLLRNLQIPTIPQYTLKLIGLGLTSDTEIASALGLDKAYVHSALATLDQLQLVQRVYHSSSSGSLGFVVTDRGNQALDLMLTALETERLDVLVDGFTGEFSPIESTQLHRGPDLKKEDVLCLDPVPKTRPTLDHLNSRIKDLNKFMQPEISRPSDKYDLIEVHGIERINLEYRPVNVLAFQDPKTNRLEFRVFAGYEPLTMYDRILADRDRAGTRVIPPSLLVPISQAPIPSELMLSFQPKLEQLKSILESVHNAEAQVVQLKSTIDILSSIDNEASSDTVQPITEKSAKILTLEEQLIRQNQELEQLRSQVGENKIIEAWEHRNLLLKAIKSAKERLLLVSPWITGAATNNEVIKALASAIKRGVWIAIAYGIEAGPDPTRESALQPHVEQEFVRLKQQPNGDRFHFEGPVHTHEKILVCDAKFCIVTSFNWLSYRGQGLRQEMGVHMKSAADITTVTQKVLSRFKSLPKGFPTTV